MNVLLIDERTLRTLVRLLDTMRAPEPREPESHQIARELLGPDFHGPDAVERHFGPLTAEDRERLREVRIRDHRTGRLLTEEDTLRVVEACKGTHVLVATRAISLASLHAGHKDGFYNDPDLPWFGQPDQRRKWSDAATADPWLLVRKDVLPGSTGKTAAQQNIHLAQEFPRERALLPVEFCHAALLHQKETGELLCPNHVVRFPVQTAEGLWVSVYWGGGRLYVSGWDGDAHDDVGAVSARTS